MAKRASSRKTATGRSKKAGESRSSQSSRKSAGKTADKTSAKSTHLTAQKPAARQLTKAQLSEFRRMLLSKRRELVGDMTGIEAEALGADRQESKGDISDHPADAGTDNFEQEFSLGLLESERALLAEIDEALKRIDEGTYGVCLGTGRPIGTARLKARPWSRYGIEYARMVEKGLVRPGDRIAATDEGEGGLDEEDEEAEEDLDGHVDVESHEEFEEHEEVVDHEEGEVE